MRNPTNCIIVDDEKVARNVLETHLAKVPNMNVVGSCKDVLEAFQIVSSQRVDLIFLDINLPEISGLAFAKSISRDIKVIFTTAYREFAVDGFDLQAVDYLLKPISFERLLKAINRYIEVTPPAADSPIDEILSDRNDFFFVRSERKMVKIRYNDIQFIESLSDYVRIHLTDTTVITRETITNIEARLPQKDFIRVHRSFIVSLASIDSFTNDDIIIKGKEIPISRSYRDEVMGRLSNTP